MRLTVHRLNQIPTLHQAQVALILEDASLPEQAEFYLATFNDRAVALAWRLQSDLQFIAVRDITRRRGIGQELLRQIKLDTQAAGLTQLHCDLAQAPTPQQAGLNAFLQAQGFNGATAMLSCNLE
ncbi:acetyl-CoA sensor PanZ family protein [Oceanisphaera sp. W20_SRM_FM3]|uniref:acetyl-CoA sensor PanZ family protein n=1 Tax=Oceanisphaera sp. W20_SRM_FM3 TaxID=3240267 RepID=UPI003F98C5B6